MIRTAIPKNASGIYLIKSIINGKIYIGSAVNLKRRKEKEHFYNLQLKKHHNIHLQRHYNKYGKNDLIFGILEFCDKIQLINREQYWIDNLHPAFNIAKKAGNTLGLKYTEKQKQKLKKPKSKIHKQHIKESKIKFYSKNESPLKGRKLSNEFIEKNSAAQKKFWESEKGSFAKLKFSERQKNIPNPMVGKHHSEETKKKIGDANRGRIISEETKQKLSQSRKGRVISMETRIKLSIANKGKGGLSGKLNHFYGKKHTKESIEKIRLSRIGKIPWNKRIKD